MMRKLLRPGSWASLAGVLVVGLSVGSADDVGYVRLGPPAKPVVRGQSDVIDQAGVIRQIFSSQFDSTEHVRQALISLNSAVGTTEKRQVPGQGGTRSH